jgi:hypothetical protein
VRVEDDQGIAQFHQLANDAAGCEALIGCLAQTATAAATSSWPSSLAAFSILVPSLPPPGRELSPNFGDGLKDQAAA